MKAGPRSFLMVLSLLFALSVPLYSVRLIAFLLFFLLLSATIHNRLVSRLISVRRMDPELRAGRHQAMVSRFELRNRLPIPLPRMTVIESPGQLYCDNPAAELLLHPGGREIHSFVLRGERRGLYQFGPLRLHGRDPLGLLPWEGRELTLGRAVILPRIPPIRIAERFGVAGGSLAAANPVYEDVSRFRSVREYSAGDDPKRVNWKTSAKRGRLYTTEYERSLTVSVTIILDLAKDDYPIRRREQSLERAVEVAAALVFNYSRLGQPLGMLAAASLPPEGQGGLAEQRTEDTTISFAHSTGWAHTQQLLDTLARVVAKRGSADYLALVFGRKDPLPAGGRLQIVGPEPSEEQVAQLRGLRARRLRIDYYWVGAESAVTPGPLDGVCPVHRVREVGGVADDA